MKRIMRVCSATESGFWLGRGRIHGTAGRGPMPAKGVQRQSPLCGPYPSQLHPWLRRNPCIHQFSLISHHLMGLVILFAFSGAFARRHIYPTFVRRAADISMGRLSNFPKRHGITFTHTDFGWRCLLVHLGRKNWKTYTHYSGTDADVNINVSADASIGFSADGVDLLDQVGYRKGDGVYECCLVSAEEKESLILCVHIAATETW